MIARLRRLAASGHLREIMTFLIVGGSSAMVFVALTSALTTFAGWRPSLAILATLAVLIPPTYAAQRRLTFRSDRSHLGAFPRYLATQAVGQGIGLVAAEVAADTIRSQPLVAFFILAFVVAVVNYGFLKLWTFRRAPASPGLK